jgi:hypothetical protein
MSDNGPQIESRLRALELRRQRPPHIERVLALAPGPGALGKPIFSRTHCGDIQAVLALPVVCPAARPSRTRKLTEKATGTRTRRLPPAEMRLEHRSGLTCLDNGLRQHRFQRKDARDGGLWRPFVTGCLPLSACRVRGRARRQATQPCANNSA